MEFSTRLPSCLTEQCRPNKTASSLKLQSFLQSSWNICHLLKYIIQIRHVYGAHSIILVLVLNDFSFTRQHENVAMILNVHLLSSVVTVSHYFQLLFPLLTLVISILIHIHSQAVMGKKSKSKKSG